jgi:gamma-glutamyltranspeptidase / glutathione hydrolase
MTMQEAVNAGRFHHQWLPDVVQYESAAFHANIMNELSNRGHTFKLRSSIGRVDAILIRPDKSLEGAADPRGDDTARGY